MSTRLRASRDLTGEVFKRLTVLRRLPNKEGVQNTFWQCECVCGNVVEVRGSNLYASISQSCGCLKRELLAISKSTHGDTRGGRPSTEWKAWSGIRERCYNPSNHKYSSYGGRGIVVCPRWLSSFEAFLADMGRKPSSRHSIERVDNSKGYSPDNCVWALPDVQSANKRNVTLVCWDDHVMPLGRAASHFGISPKTVYTRISKHGWSISQALTNPLQWSS